MIILYFVYILSILMQGGFFPVINCIIGFVLLIVIIKKKYRIPIFSFPLLALIILYIVSLIINNPSLEGISHISKIICCYLFFILVSNFVNDKENKHLLIQIIKIGGVLVSTIGILSFLKIIPLSGYVTANRLQSTFQYANATGIFLATSAYIIHVKKWSIATIYIETSLLLTQSVGAISVYFVAVFFTMFFAKQTKENLFFTQSMVASIFLSLIIYLSRYNIIFSVISVFLLLILYFLSEKIEMLFSKIYKKEMFKYVFVFITVSIVAIIFFIRGFRPFYTYLERITMLKDAILGFLHKPLLGFGAGKWENVFEYYQSSNYDARFIHNGYLQGLIDVGIVFIPIVFIMILYWFKNSSDITSKIPVIMILVHATMDITFMFTSIVFLLVMIFCLSLDEKEIKIINLQIILKFFKNSSLNNYISFCFKKTRTYYYVTISKGILIIFMTIFIYTLSGNLLLNKASYEKKQLKYQDVIQTLNKYKYFNSYKMTYIIFESMYLSQNYDGIDKIMFLYDTSKSMHLKALVEINRKDYKKALQYAEKCSELAPFQNQGEELIKEIKKIKK